MDWAPGEHLHHFHGGLRLRHNKKIACTRPIGEMPLLQRYVVPVSQHSGAPATPLVEAGDQVLRGQCIAARSDLPGAKVHAPTSGTVSIIEEHPLPHPFGRTGPCVVIQADGLDQSVSLPAVADYQNLPREELMQRLDQAGIVGLGGAVFSTRLKVEGAQEDGIHTVILNGAECEPYIACDEMLMREHSDRILDGALILHYLTDAQQVIIAIEDQMGAVKQIFTDAIEARGISAKVKVVQVTTIYPEGGERQLIQVLTGKEVPHDGLPKDMGLLVQNVATAAAVADAILDGMPLIRRVVTVTGPGITEPRNLWARIGTTVAELVAFCGGYRPQVSRLIMGGPLMGIALSSDQVPVVKAFNCALALTEKDIEPPQPEMPCINCGECVRVCPAQLLPQELHRYIAAKDFSSADELRLFACIECGCCDFVCPSHIPLVDYYRYGKGEIRRLRQEKQASDHARDRFQAREDRLLRIKQERRAAREKKKQALADKAARQDSIQAALDRVEARKKQREDS